MGSPPLEQERENRSRVVGGSVNEEEEREVLAAFQTAGIKVKSKAARVVLLAYARSTKVRDAVTAFIADNPVLLAD